MLESPTGTQANKYVLSETTDKFSSVQEVAMFASLMLQILKNLGLSEFEARLPTIPPRRYFLSFKSTGRKTDRPSLQLHCVRQTCKRRYEMRSIQAKNAPPPPLPSGRFPFDRSTYGQNSHDKVHIPHITIEITQNSC